MSEKTQDDQVEVSPCCSCPTCTIRRLTETITGKMVEIDELRRELDARRRAEDFLRGRVAYYEGELRAIGDGSAMFPIAWPTGGTSFASAKELEGAFIERQRLRVEVKALRSELANCYSARADLARLQARIKELEEHPLAFAVVAEDGQSVYALTQEGIVEAVHERDRLRKNLARATESLRSLCRAIAGGRGVIKASWIRVEKGDRGAITNDPDLVEIRF